jgi:hypothetical protein
MFSASLCLGHALRRTVTVLVLAIVLLTAFLAVAQTEGSAAPLPAGTWRFIVSGDSRNCGDIIVPAIAAQSSLFTPSFYWHLGDLRAIYKIDEDIAFSRTSEGSRVACETYHRLAWKDFVANQIGAFGNLPVYVGIGNHEVIPPKNEDAFKREFADWLDQPTLRRQREADKEPTQPEPYYHWIQGGVDFIYLDNSSDCFSDQQMSWFRRRLAAAKLDATVKSVVVGMHEALPRSFSSSHSMGDKADEPLSLKSGSEVYAALVEFRKTKPVYVLASHSHFFMENIYSTPELTAKGADPLPGWIVGAAGAVRYALPDQRPASPAKSQTDTYGYLLGTVSPDGKIQFSYQEISQLDVPQYVWGRYTASAILWCFEHNSLNREPNAPELTMRCPSQQVPTCGHP